MRVAYELVQLLNRAKSNNMKSIIITAFAATALLVCVSCEKAPESSGGNTNTEKLGNAAGVETVSLKVTGMT